MERGSNGARPGTTITQSLHQAKVKKQKGKNRKTFFLIRHHQFNVIAIELFNIVLTKPEKKWKLFGRRKNKHEICQVFWVYGRNKIAFWGNCTVRGIINRSILSKQSSAKKGSRSCLFNEINGHNID